VKKKVAFVVMRYGKEINGGAELLCRVIAERMTRHWDVSVLTTCAVDYVHWKNELPAGQETIEQVEVRRFPVSRERQGKLFNRIYDILARRVLWERVPKGWGSTSLTRLKHFIRLLYRFLFGPLLLGYPIERIWMWLQGPSSRELRNFIKQNSSNYDAFFFLTNTYATTYYNLSEVSKKAVVIPAAHDEPCLYFNIFDSKTKHANAFIYSTPEEKMLFEARFRFAADTPNRVIGIGIDQRTPGSGERFRQKHKIEGDYIIYVGRIEKSKGCHTLFEYFQEFLKNNNLKLKLILLGKPAMPIPTNPNIISLGFVSEEDKYDAISGANCLVMPSPYESLSIVLLEAWMCNTAVIVNGLCEVLDGQCKRAGGGFAYRNYEEFSKALNSILNDPDNTKRMADSGRIFTEKTYMWSKIEKDYLEVLDTLPN
jgi:glycosyltransferase involved in cell wall biosynthesis